MNAVNGQDMEHWRGQQWLKLNQQGLQQESSTQTCVPFVSQYTDCSDQNQCDGCTKCTCSKVGSWECESVKICGNKADDDEVDSDAFERAINRLDLEMKEAEPRAKNSAPSPTTGNQKSASEELMEKMKAYAASTIPRGFPRLKRSSNKKKEESKHSKRSTETTNKRITRNSSKNNNTVKFYSTVDELNEDTLKHLNISGTLPAKRVELNTVPDSFRRSNVEDNNNKSLHIDFNVPKINNQITDNKIDLDHENKLNLSHEKINAVLGNHTNENKDKDLSKLVVNELKAGKEVIGDTKAPVTSNITFTSENDTLTAMAYIAGNLLNKLWSMEKDSSGNTMETDDLKQEKISDLLDLFKEPLNLRQETFLKNVLESLSNVIDKDKEVKNVTLCQTLEEASKLLDNHNNFDETDSDVVVIKEKLGPKKNKTKTSKKAVVKAISKIDNVLGLIRKFDNIEQNLNNLKQEPSPYLRKLNNTTQPINKQLLLDTMFTKDEANSLNTFGDILSKITKLLLPKKSNKKITNLIKDKNMLNDNQSFRNNVMKMFNVDLTNQTVNTKDKLILDYLAHINSNPDCILNKNHQNVETKSLPDIEGNILLNLSEFFKMKSFADLLTLIEPAKSLRNMTIRTSETVKTTTESIKTTTVVVEKPQSNTLQDRSKKFAATKEKLKTHLKTIIEDLIELQDAKGIHPRGNIRIADALPCIYNIMNSGPDILNQAEEKKPSSIVSIFKELKNEMKLAKTRRNDDIMPVRPKSAVVLERMVKNLAGKLKPKTRRVLNIKSFRPLDEVKTAIYKIRNISSSYKTQALFTSVPPAERLVLLKALEQEVKNYITALEGVRQASKNLKKLPSDQYADLEQFIYNILTNISLNEKVLNKYDKISSRKNVIDLAKRIVTPKIQEKPLATTSNGKFDNNNEMKISRHQIISHIIRKRIQSYLNLKDVREFNVNNDLNYNVAKRIIHYLDNGNNELAYELFKMFVTQKEQQLNVPPSFLHHNIKPAVPVPSPKPIDNPVLHNPLIRSQPLNQFQEPKLLDNQMKWMSQDHLIKQLLNIKNMGV